VCGMAVSTAPYTHRILLIAFTASPVGGICGSPAVVVFGRHDKSGSESAGRRYSSLDC
jgi:hypothetical protein